MGSPNEPAVLVPPVRADGLGASEIASALGLSPWESQLDLVLKKKGQAIIEDNENMAWGRALEPVLLERLRREVGAFQVSTLRAFDALGLTADRVAVFPEHPTQMSIRHAEWPLLWATPDAILWNQEVDVYDGAEVKNRSPWMAERYGHTVDDIPVEVALQCHGGLMATGLKVWHFGAYFGGANWKRVTVLRDEAMYPGILETLQEFWQRHIIGDEPPPVTSRDLETLKRLFPKHTTDLVLTATEQQDADIAEFRTLADQIKGLEERRDQVRADLQAAIGTAAGLSGPSGAISWKANKDSIETNWKAIAEELLGESLLTPTGRQQLIDRYTTTKPGARPFRVTKPKGVVR